MSGKPTQAMLRAVELVRLGARVTEAARAQDVNLQALRKALRRSGVPPAAPGRPKTPA